MRDFRNAEFIDLQKIKIEYINKFRDIPEGRPLLIRSVALKES